MNTVIVSQLAGAPSRRCGRERDDGFVGSGGATMDADPDVSQLYWSPGGGAEVVDRSTVSLDQPSLRSLLDDLRPNLDLLSAGPIRPTWSCRQPSGQQHQPYRRRSGVRSAGAGAAIRMERMAQFSKVVQ